MKKTLLFGFVLGVSGLIHAQCEITGPELMCLGDAPASLEYTAIPTVDAAAVEFSGPGVLAATFNPAEAGLGTHTISATAPGDGYAIDETVPFSMEALTGATVVALGDDDVSGDLPIGFTFRYFGNDYDNFRISSNGFIAFPDETDDGCCEGLVMPDDSDSEPKNNIAICWDDLRPPSGGTISYETIGTAPDRVCVVYFDTVVHYFSGPKVITGQIKLFETTNCVEIHVEKQDDTGGAHTLGMQNKTGTEAFVAPGKNGTAWTASNFAIGFCPHDGCTTEFEIEVVASPNVFGEADVTEICLGEEVTFTASGDADVYEWGTGITDGEPYTPDTPGPNVFVVAGEDTGSGCVGTASVNVYVHDIPFVDAGSDTSYCADWEFAVEGVSDDSEVTFEWDNGAEDGVLMTQEEGVVTYTVIGTNAGGCEATSSVKIESFPVPTGTGEVTMMTGDAYDGEIDFMPEGGTGGPYTFLWSNGETTEDIGALTIGTYTVTVSDGKCDSDVTFFVDSQAGIALNELGNLKIYPNPVVDQFAIEFEGTYNWTLFDNVGKVVANGQANGKELIDMSKIAAGSYVVQVEVDGKKSITPLVKE